MCCEAGSLFLVQANRGKDTGLIGRFLRVQDVWIPRKTPGDLNLEEAVKLYNGVSAQSH
jgi:hypothetical protein